MSLGWVRHLNKCKLFYLLWCEERESGRMKRASAKPEKSQHETLGHCSWYMPWERSNCSQICPLREGQTGVIQTYTVVCVVILTCLSVFGCLCVCISAEESHLSVNVFHFCLSIGGPLNLINSPWPCLWPLWNIWNVWFFISLTSTYGHILAHTQLCVMP